MVPSCSLERRAWNASRSCTHFCASTNAPPAPGSPSGTERDVERLLDRRVLGAVDEAGEVAAVEVDEARLLGGERRPPAPEHASTARGATSSSTSSPVPWDPHPEVVLRRRRARRPSPSIGLEVGELRRRVVGLQPAPEVGAEADHDVRPARGDRRLAQRRRARRRSRRRWRPGAGRTRGGSASGCPGRRCRAGEASRRKVWPVATATRQPSARSPDPSWSGPVRYGPSQRRPTRGPHRAATTVAHPVRSHRPPPHPPADAPPAPPAGCSRRPRRRSPSSAPRSDPPRALPRPWAAPRPAGVRSGGHAGHRPHADPTDRPPGPLAHRRRRAGWCSCTA